MPNNFYRDILLLNLKDYQNIGVDFYVNIFLAFALLALGAAFFYINHNRGIMSLVIKQLIRHGAKTLSEIGLNENRSAKRLLKKDGQLTKIVARVGKIKYTYEEYVALSKKDRQSHDDFDIDAARFYISEDQKKRAENIYENYGGSIVRTVLYLILLCTLYVCFALVMPQIVSALDNFIGSLK